MYSEKLMKLFRNPHNMGSIKNADGVGKVGNPVCGDVMYLYIKVKNEKITDIKFETFGCVAAIATSSIITDLAKGKTIEHAAKLTKDDVVKELGGLPPLKIHCSLLAIDALHAAINDYKNKIGKIKDKKGESKKKEKK
jgi:nitrogen fixation NifU-like protein